MKKMVLVEVTKAYELQAERPSAERPTKSDLISESFSYLSRSPHRNNQYESQIFVYLLC
jgi:hypothetical protein